MLPGKKYTPEEVIRIFRTRLWFVVVPAAVIAAATALVTRTLPNRYRSDTLILVVPQRVPEAYVKSTVTARIEDRLPSISQQILSRTRLERIIQDFDLYREERQTGLMEDVVAKMRRDIDARVVGGKGDAFRVSYTGSDPRTVMHVTERLASLFIDENLRDREILAEGTNQFLESQLEDARRRLVEHEKKLEAYRIAHSGELPTQLPSNIQVINNTQTQVQSIIESLNRDRDRKLIVQRQLADAEAEPPAPPPVIQNPADPNAAAGTTAQQLEAARATLRGLELRFKPEHPDIGIWQRRIRDLEKQAAAEAAAAPVARANPTTTATSPADTARLRRISDMKAEIELLDRQITQKLAEEQRLRSWAASVQARVDAAPTRESEMTELTRDYATLQTLYSSLMNKREESRLAANLERRQVGQQFKLLDPAQLPQKPISPDRPMFTLMGLAAGGLLGLAFVGLLEYRDSSFKTDEEMVALLTLPVLAVVPSMRSEAERRSRRRRQVALSISLASTVTVCFAVVIYTVVR